MIALGIVVACAPEPPVPPLVHIAICDVTGPCPCTRAWLIADAAAQAETLGSCEQATFVVLFPGQGYADVRQEAWPGKLQLIGNDRVDRARCVASISSWVASLALPVEAEPVDGWQPNRSELVGAWQVVSELVGDRAPGAQVSISIASDGRLVMQRGGWKVNAEEEVPAASETWASLGESEQFTLHGVEQISWCGIGEGGEPGGTGRPPTSFSDVKAIRALWRDLLTLAGGPAPVFARSCLGAAEPEPPEIQEQVPLSPAAAQAAAEIEKARAYATYEARREALLEAGAN